MKKKTLNIITSMLGIVAIIFIPITLILLAKNGVILSWQIVLSVIFGYLAAAVILFYFKNTDAQALLFRALDKFKK